MAHHNCLSYLLLSLLFVSLSPLFPFAQKNNQLHLLLPRPGAAAHPASRHRALLLCRLLQPRRHQASSSGQRTRLPTHPLGLGSRRHPPALQGVFSGGVWARVLPPQPWAPRELWHGAHQVLENGLHLHWSQAAGEFVWRKRVSACWAVLCCGQHRLASSLDADAITECAVIPSCIRCTNALLHV